MKKYGQIACVILALSGLTLGRADAGLPVYSITDLGQSFTDSTEVDAVAINSAGQVLLSTLAPDGSEADIFLSQNGALQDLGLPAFPGDTAGQVVGLSDAGQIAGTSQQQNGAPRAFLTGNGVLTNLGSLGGPLGTTAYGVSKTGHIVGTSDTGSGIAAFLDSGGVLRSLPFLPGSGNGDCGAYGVNSTDQVVGYAQSGLVDANGNATQHAVLWQNGAIQDLGALAGPNGNSFAEAINDHAQIVGASENTAGNLDAFFRDQGTMQDLGTLGGSFSDAHGINNAAQVVGESDTGQTNPDQSPITHAFLWQRGTLADLNAVLPAYSGWVLTRAVAINDAGQIVGTGLHTVNGVTYTHAFLLTPSRTRWTATSISTGSDGNTRLQWNNANGWANYWNFDAANNPSYDPVYGPYSGWTARKSVAGPNGSTTIFWTNANGSANYWTVNANGSIYYAPVAGPFDGWTATDLTVGPDGKVRLLWDNVNGWANYWTFNTNGSINYGPLYGPYAGWTATSISTGSDGNTRVQWNNVNGWANYWTFDAANNVAAYGPVYGPYSGWTARKSVAGPNGSTTIFWTNADGSANYWTINGNGSIYYAPVAGPYSGWTATDLTVGPDGKVRLLWDNASGAANYWTFNTNGSITYGPVYGPY